MGKFQDIPYHIALPNIESVKAYQWLLEQIDYPAKREVDQSQQVTQLLRKMVYEMTAAKKTKTESKTQGKKQNGDTTWLTIRLTSQHEAELSEYGIPFAQIIDDLLILVAEGGGFTVKQTNDGESFNAYAFLPSGGDSTHTYAASAFAGNPQDALLVLHYKVFVLIGDDPAKWAVTEKRRFG